MNGDVIDLSHGRVDLRVEEKPGPKAAEMLVEEVRLRTGLTLPILTGGLKEGPGLILTQENGPASRPEGYRITADAARRQVEVRGCDGRGLLFGVGRLLRLMEYGDGALSLDAGAELDEAPSYPMRGHQLGFRRRSNTYDSWGIAEYEAYIRDLIAWGANSIELIPPVASPDVINRFEFGQEAMRMTRDLSRLLDSYDLDVHLWLPVNDKVLPGMDIEGFSAGDHVCPSRPEGRDFMLGVRRELFEALVRVDGVFIPGGDPAGCECSRCQPWARTLVPLAEDIAGVLAESHPGAGIWLSNQDFSRDETDFLLDYIRTKRPKWLRGLVHAPWVPDSPSSLRERLPEGYMLRSYPDLCHSLRCQYPVPDWDHAYGLIEGREAPNPRPRDFAHIHRLYAGSFCGSISYSDGVNDDVNKFVFSALDWSGGAGVEEILEEYARYFMGGEAADQVARGILALEDNWRGRLADRTSVEEVLKLWKGLDASAGTGLKENWRYQLCQLRAHLDAYVRRKLLSDAALEAEALLEMGKLLGSRDKVGLARVLELLSTPGGDAVLRRRIEDLAGQLNQSIGMKLGRRYRAHSERADILDFLDEPLNNADWLRTEIEGVADGRCGLQEGIQRIMGWEDPGPGGFYDDLGCPGREPRRVRRRTWEEDPGGLESSMQEIDFLKMKGGRLSWRRQAMALWGNPIEMHYDDLDNEAGYDLRVTYGGFRRPATLRLDTAGGLQIHGPLELPNRSTQYDFPIPTAATAAGSLDLVWSLVRREGSLERERGIAVAEAWLFQRQGS